MENNDSQKFAVVKLSGSQKLVVEGAVVKVNRMPNQVGESLTVPNLLNGEKVTLQVKEHGKGEKITGLKFKNKVRYLKRYGHRQLQTTLVVESIGEKKTLKKETPKKTAEIKTKKATTKAKK